MTSLMRTPLVVVLTSSRLAAARACCNSLLSLPSSSSSVKNNSQQQRHFSAIQYTKPTVSLNLLNNNNNNKIVNSFVAAAYLSSQPDAKQTQDRIRKLIKEKSVVMFIKGNDHKRLFVFLNFMCLFLLFS